VLASIVQLKVACAELERSSPPRPGLRRSCTELHLQFNSPLLSSISLPTGPDPYFPNAQPHLIHSEKATGKAEMTTPTPDQIKTLEQSRQRLVQLTHSLGSLITSLNQSDPLPSWCDLPLSNHFLFYISFRPSKFEC
jgi:hypothetical protein